MTLHAQDDLSQHKHNDGMLGQKIKTFPDGRIGSFRWELVISGVFLNMLSFAFGVINLGKLIIGINRHGRAILLTQSHPVLIHFFLIVPIGLVIMILGVHHWHDSITLYENGFLRQLGKTSQTWMWSETTSLDSNFRQIVFAGSTVAFLEQILLTSQDSRIIKIKNHNQKCTELVSNIRQKILPVLHKNAINELRIGKMIQFHEELIVKLRGMEIRGAFYPWSEISILNKKNGIFELLTQTNQKTIYHQRFRNIKNFDTFTHLINNPPINY